MRPLLVFDVRVARVLPRILSSGGPLPLACVGEAAGQRLRCMHAFLGEHLFVRTALRLELLFPSFMCGFVAALCLLVCVTSGGVCLLHAMGFGLPLPRGPGSKPRSGLALSKCSLSTACSAPLVGHECVGRSTVCRGIKVRKTGFLATCAPPASFSLSLWVLTVVGAVVVRRCCVLNTHTR